MVETSQPRFHINIILYMIATTEPPIKSCSQEFWDGDCENRSYDIAGRKISEMYWGTESLNTRLTLTLWWSEHLVFFKVQSYCFHLPLSWDRSILSPTQTSICIARYELVRIEVCLRKQLYRTIKAKNRAINRTISHDF